MGLGELRGWTLAMHIAKATVQGVTYDYETGEWIPPDDNAPE